jgi:hypothetical protein
MKLKDSVKRNLFVLFGLSVILTSLFVWVAPESWKFIYFVPAGIFSLGLLIKISRNRPEKFLGLFPIWAGAFCVAVWIELSSQMAVLFILNGLLISGIVATTLRILYPIKEAKR